jgi:anti-sigma B factor antagonist
VFQERTVGNVRVISLAGSLKGECEVALKGRLDELARQGHKDIVVDMAACPHSDSTELGRLVRCHLAVRQAGGRVRLCRVSPRVRRLLEMTRLDTVLDLFVTEAEALAAIAEADVGRDTRQEAPVNGAASG